MAIGTGAAILGSAIIGGGLSAWGANKAAGAQEDAASRGLDAQTRFATEARQLLKPYTDTGSGAVTTLARLYGLPGSGQEGTPFGPAATQAFQNSPDYAFAMKEGVNALGFSNAAKGMLNSGNYLRDLTGFGQGLASQNFNNYAQRLMQLAGMGQGAASTAAGQGMNAGNAMADSFGNIGQAQASGIVGGTNAINQSLGSATNNLMLYNMLQNQGGSAYGGSAGAIPWMQPAGGLTQQWMM